MSPPEPRRFQAPVDAAEDELNFFIAMMRSIYMTIAELNGLDIDTKTLTDSKNDLSKSIQAAANKYIQAFITARKQIQPLKAQIGTIHDDYESPID